MDITGHFESASCVIEVDGSDTLAHVKGKLVAELGVPRARGVGVRMRGGGDIGNDDLRICDTVMDEGCAVELYYAGANITPGVIPYPNGMHTITLSPCDRYLAVICAHMSIFDTEKHECLCRFPCLPSCDPVFSPCSEWISYVNNDTQCAEVRDVNTGALEHSFGDEGDEMKTTAWSPCGTKLLSCCKSKGLQVWDIATGVVVHEWSHIVECHTVMVVKGDRVAIVGHNSRCITIWDYTTGVEVLLLTNPYTVDYLALTPNQRFIASCDYECARVWNIETGECVVEKLRHDYCTRVAASNDIVAAYSFCVLSVWSISTGKQLFNCDLKTNDSRGVAISSCGGVVIYGTSDGVEIVDISHVS